MARRVEVDYQHGDAPHRDEYTADKVRARVFPSRRGPGRGWVRLKDGHDGEGPVSWAMYSQVIRIKCREG
jgi:hypothetical protein